MLLQTRLHAVCSRQRLKMVFECRCCVVPIKTAPTALHLCLAHSWGGGCTQQATAMGHACAVGAKIGICGPFGVILASFSCYISLLTSLMSHYSLPTTPYLLPTIHYPLPTIHYQLPTIHSSLLDTHSPLPSTLYLLPTIQYSPPTTHYYPLPTPH